MQSNRNKWRSLGGFAVLNVSGSLVMLGLLSVDAKFGLSVALLIRLGLSFIAMKRNIIDPRTHFETMLLLGGLYVTLIVSLYHLDLGKLLSIGLVILLIKLLNRRYQEILLGR